MKETCFSTQQVKVLTSTTTRQLGYWRDTELITPSHYTPGGHARYSFTDIIIIKAIQQLITAGVSIQRIRKISCHIQRLLPTLSSPLSEVSLLVTRDAVLIFRDNNAYDVATGQQWILSVARLHQEIEQYKKTMPEQYDLFPGRPAKAVTLEKVS